MSEEITINELLKGKATLIKSKEFFPTKNYVEPFLERMSRFTDDFRVQVKLPDQITKIGSVEDTTFNRVVVQAVMPEKYCIDNHDEVIGMVYGIDVRKPVVKFYRGNLNKVCTNLSIFSPSFLNIQELVPGEPINYAPIKALMEQTSTFEVINKKLKTTFLDRDEQTNYLGQWVDKSLKDYQDYGYGKVKLASSVPIEAYKQLYLDQNSDYFIDPSEDPSLFDIYNSFTDIISHDSRDILNKTEKILLLNKILDISNL